VNNKVQVRIGNPPLSRARFAFLFIYVCVSLKIRQWTKRKLKRTIMDKQK